MFDERAQEIMRQINEALGIPPAGLFHERPAASRFLFEREHQLLLEKHRKALLPLPKRSNAPGLGGNDTLTGNEPGLGSGI